MLFRMVDNADGSILAIAFDEETIKRIASTYDEEARVPGDPETYRYCWEDCYQHCEGHADQIGDTLAQLGRHIQWGRDADWRKSTMSKGNILKGSL